MRVVVPFDPVDPNSRLSALLSSDERREFAVAMLADVLAAVREAGGTPEVLAAAPVSEDALGTQDVPVTENARAVEDVPVTVDDRSLSVAVNDALDDLPAAVVMADLALVTPADIRTLLESDGDVALAPGQRGGTNAVVVRHPGFRVDYHGASYRDHVAAAGAVDATVETVDSFRLAVDVDEPTDLVDVLVHGEGAAADWLRDAGFELAVRDGDPVVEPNA